MNDVYICMVCREAYEPVLVNGIRQLKTFNGYTVDLRLQQFRKAEYGKRLECIDFTSPKGQVMLHHMHEALISE